MRLTRAEAGNVGFVCKVHESKPGKYKDQDPEKFIGKFVKLGFQTNCGTKEHMWVKVEHYNKETLELEGVLNNDPIYDVGYECGDGVGFKVEEIEDVLET